MSQIIPIDWYVESPIDFEHKQYVILSYLQKVDLDFIEKRLSPHFLHMEKMMIDMVNFQESLADIRKKFNKQRYYLLFHDNPKLEGEDNMMVEEIEEIIGFSIPQIQTRINLGQRILKRNKQVLY